MGKGNKVKEKERKGLKPHVKKMETNALMCRPAVHYRGVEMCGDGKEVNEKLLQRRRDTAGISSITSMSTDRFGGGKQKVTKSPSSRQKQRKREREANIPL